MTQPDTMPSEKVDKKRKRASDRHERPTKKTALQALPTLAASVIEDKSELAPVIGMCKFLCNSSKIYGFNANVSHATATTPGVLNSKGLRFNPYIKNRQDVEQTATRNPGIVSTEMLLQSSEHQKMDFVGREGTGEDADSQLKHYIAVVDPERKTWQVIEARRVTVRGAVRSRKPEEDEEESEEEMVCPCRSTWVFSGCYLLTVS